MNFKSLLLLAGMLTQSALVLPAAPVTFWYGGYITSIDDPSNAAPFAVKEGMPFTGKITFDGSLAESSSTNGVPGGLYSQHYFNSTAGYSMLFQIGGHVVMNAANQGSLTGDIIVGDQYNDRDVLWFETNPGGDILLDGAPFVTYPRFSGLNLNLEDDTTTALTSPALPTSAPDLAKFQSYRQISWGVYIDDGNPTQVFSVSGEITVISANEVVFLSQVKTAASTLRLSWPRSHSGFALQSTTNLPSGPWDSVTNAIIDVGLEHTVTISTTGPQRFYRLRK